jgi:hypothetical protein
MNTDLTIRQYNNLSEEQKKLYKPVIKNKTTIGYNTKTTSVSDIASSVLSTAAGVGSSLLTSVENSASNIIQTSLK